MQKNVLEYLENMVKRYPHKKAFEDELHAYTFLEFQIAAKKIATQICKETNQTNQPIIVLVDRDVESLICFMAVLYSGNFYVPVDSKMPKQRMECIMEQVKPITILNPKECVAQTQELEIQEAEIQNRMNQILDVDPVYVIFTSGSTGVPKGIVISHKSVIDFTDWMAETFQFSETDIMGNQAPFYFDLSVKDIYTTLKCGATTYILSKKMLIFPTLLIDYLNEKNITSLIWATSAFHLVSNSKVLEKKKIESLHKVILGGEALLAKHLNVWKRAMPQVQYVNLYGPTEVTVDCTYYKINREFADDEAIPIGKACENKEILLLDENLQEVKNGEAGEICVRGTGLAKGYYNDFEKTRQVFVQNPKNPYYPDLIYRTGDIGIRNEKGEIIFQSRKDGQIKHMGYRIELGEIERAINAFEKIKTAVCFYDEMLHKIVCIYEGETTEAEIIIFIATMLPKYMFPNILKQYDKMPYNANGKIDRVKLREEYLAKSKEDKV